jgi:hypothetical protein
MPARPPVKLALQFRLVDELPGAIGTQPEHLTDHPLPAGLRVVRENRSRLTIDESGGVQAGRRF